MEYFLAVGAVLDDGELPIAALEHLHFHVAVEPAVLIFDRPVDPGISA